MPSRDNLIIAHSWLLSCALLLIPAVALAGSGTELSLPAMGVKNKSGLRMSIDGRGIDGNGYRPIRIEVE